MTGGKQLTHDVPGFSRGAMGQPQHPTWPGTHGSRPFELKHYIARGLEVPIFHRETVNLYMITPLPPILATKWVPLGLYKARLQTISRQQMI